MKLSTSFSAAKRCCHLHSPHLPKTTQGNLKAKASREEFASKLLDRRWSLEIRDTRIDQIKLSSKRVQRQDGRLYKRSWFHIAKPSLGAEVMEKICEDPSFYIVRDDLLHPLINGNKARKLDAVLPLLEDYKITDVVTCGGCQSAHAAAVAVSCAERGLKSHLLLRGEQPDILTGYNLISTIYGKVTYIPRSIYANREDMLNSHANLLVGKCGETVSWSDMIGAPLVNETNVSSDFAQKSAHRDPENCLRKVAIISEGAGDFAALLGVMRLVFYLAQNHLLGKDRTIKFVVDAGTGTTAVGLGLAAKCLGLPWEINAVMLADTIDNYRQQERRLMSDFKKHFGSHFECKLTNLDSAVVHWVDRCHPRKFGNVMKGELEACQQIAQQTGILLDPIYTLAGWELATSLCEQEAGGGGAAVVMLHTGGTLGMFGLAQRYKSYFQVLDDGRV